MNVPVEHWSYRAIDTLIGYGVVTTAMLGIRPFSRAEMTRLIVEAAPRIAALPPHQRAVAEGLLRRLQRTFQDEVIFHDTTTVAGHPTFLTLGEELSVQYVHVDGKPISLLPSPGIDATEGTPLVRNNEGIIYRQGDNVLLAANAYGKLWDSFAFLVQPLLALYDTDNDLEATLRLHKGYVKGQLGPVEVEFGRDSVSWGQGYRGNMVFSTHPPPFDFLKISTPQPFRLPWIFKYLGLVKADTFLAQLEDDRQDSPRTKIWGLRLLMKPTKWLEIGLLEGTQFNGDNVPGLNFDDVLKILTLQRIGTEESPEKANQLAVLDWRITLSSLRFTQFYAEIGFEDRGDIGVLAGLYVPRLTDDGRTTFRFEWMRDTIHTDVIPGVWYSHATFFSGFTFQNLVLGHASGGENQEFFTRLTRDFSARATLGVDLAYRWRQGPRLVGSQINERHYEGGLDLQYFFSHFWEVRARFAMEKVENFNLQSGVDRDNLLFGLQVKYHLF